MQETGKSILQLENRDLLNANGVQSIEVFEEEKIVLHTEQGLLEIQGTQLTIIQLDLAAGTVQIQGAIDAVVYPHERHKRQNKKTPKQSFVSKMLS